MKTEALRLGMKVNHPEYGPGTVRSISAGAAEVEFAGGRRTVCPETSELEPGEPQLVIGDKAFSVGEWMDESVAAVLGRLGIGSPDEVVEELGVRWRNGTLVMRPADPALQPKEVPLETFFHKIVMMRNNLRVLEQKVNAHPGLSDAEKVDLQQYITKCYGSMTTFNVLFKNETGQFRSKGRDDAQ